MGWSNGSSSHRKNECMHSADRKSRLLEIKIDYRSDEAAEFWSTTLYLSGCWGFFVVARWSFSKPWTSDRAGAVQLLELLRHAVAVGLAPGGSGLAESGQTLQGSFSAVSKPNFASKHSLESSRRDLHNALLCTVLESEFDNRGGKRTLLAQNSP